tara:strand:- start:8824 stop:9420 length:597 start_codon:yes stop_codon:yes gene_type:complete
MPIRIFSITVVLLFLQNLAFSQSDYMKRNESGFTVGASILGSDYTVSKIYSSSFFYTLKGRLDLGLVNTLYKYKVNQFTGHSNVRSTYTPTVNYLLIKTHGGTNIGAGIGYNLVMNSVDVNDFVFSPSISQRIGKIDKVNALVNYSFATSNGNSVSGLGISLVIPRLRYFVISPAIVFDKNDTNLGLDLRYTFGTKIK